MLIWWCVSWWRRIPGSRWRLLSRWFRIYILACFGLLAVALSRRKERDSVKTSSEKNKINKTIHSPLRTTLNSNILLENLTFVFSGFSAPFETAGGTGAPAAYSSTFWRVFNKKKITSIILHVEEKKNEKDISKYNELHPFSSFTFTTDKDDIFSYQLFNHAWLFSTSAAALESEKSARMSKYRHTSNALGRL